jgi:ribonuclease HI
MIRISSDGSCLGNPGPGAWGYVMEIEWQEGKADKGESRTKSDYEFMTTNNRMEMKAVIEALKRVTTSPELSSIPKIVVVTDSTYVKNGITAWLPNWKRRGWKKSDGNEVKNQDLWQELDALVTIAKKIEWQWVKGHSGHVGNEIANELAQKAAKLAATLAKVETGTTTTTTETSFTATETPCITKKHKRKLCSQ